MSAAGDAAPLAKRDGTEGPTGVGGRPLPRRDAVRARGQRLKCIAFDYGGTISDEGSERLDGSRLVDPSCVPVLRAIHAKGYKLVLSSNTRADEHRRAALMQAGIDDIWLAVLESGSLGIRKPDPDFYRLIMMLAKCRASEVLHVGNNVKTDVIGPQELQIRTAFVRAEGDTCEVPRGTLVIGHIRELLPVLGCEAVG